MTPKKESRLSSKERSELILAHIPRVRCIAKTIFSKLPRPVSLEDLISVGILGLIVAIDRFDSSHNVKLTTYADYRIRGSILDSVRDLDGVPAHKRTRKKLIHKATHAAAQRLQGAPDEEQVAEELGISVDVYRDWLVDVRPHAFASLDSNLVMGDRTLRLADVLPDNNGKGPEALLEAVELQQLIERALATLPPSHGRVIHYYYREGLHLPEIARILGRHPSRVWQIKDEATTYLRTYIQEHWTANRSRGLAGLAERGNHAVVG